MARSSRIQPLTERQQPGTSAGERAWDLDDDEAQIRFSLTALGEAIVSERDRRKPRFRGFGPCGRVVA